ncbi:uncharacterized protein LOC111621999 [Centruroides sculpturatus]|uniref:uncharacterized protein LOC111621999 n=1 Tax=Centruroides sculpturatus TaxID=218467 RepID=UPI000C6EF342|nr:uncharacterized protein LOC111621999 [Centruroides sculpturatus]
MKLFVFSLLVGLAVAFPYNGFCNDKRGVDNDVRSELEHLLKRIDDALEHGKTIEPDELDKLLHLLQKVKDDHVEMTDKSKQIIEKYRKILKEFFRRLIGLHGSNVHSEKRSAESFLDSLIDVLNKVRLTPGEKIDSFVEFLKETYDGGKEVLKDKATFIRDLARHFLERAEHSGKDVAEEALKFFRPYKEDLGKLYEEVEEKVKEIVRQ